MKKILSLLFIFLSLFIIGNIVYAEDVVSDITTNEQIDSNINSYDISITVNKDNTITINEIIHTGKLNGDTLFVKTFYNRVSKIESNFFELPDNAQVINGTQYNPIDYEFTLIDDTEYNLKYNVDIIGDYSKTMKFIFIPIVKKNSDTSYNDLFYRVTYDDIIQSGLSQYSNKNYCSNNISDNLFTGECKNIVINYNERGTKVKLSFNVNEQSVSNFDIYNILGLKVNGLYLAVSIIMLLIVMFLSFYKIRFRKGSLDKVITTALIIESIVTLLLMSLSHDYWYLRFFMMLCIAAFYFVFFKAVFFSGTRKDFISYLFPKIFLIAHSYLMICVFSSMESGDFNFVNIFLIILIISIVIGSIAYDYDGNGLIVRTSFDPEWVLVNTRVRLYNPDPYKNYGEFAKYFRKMKGYNLFDALMLWIPITFVATVFSIAVISEFVSVDLAYIIAPILLIAFCIVLYWFVIRNSIHNRKIDELIKHGEVYTDLPFTYENFKEAEGVVKYRIKINQEILGKSVYISEKRSDYFIYNRTKCSLLVLKDNPNIYYIDFDIPKR